MWSLLFCHYDAFTCTSSITCILFAAWGNIKSFFFAIYFLGWFMLPNYEWSFLSFKFKPSSATFFKLHCFTSLETVKMNVNWQSHKVWHVALFVWKQKYTIPHSFSKRHIPMGHLYSFCFHGMVFQTMEKRVKMVTISSLFNS